MRTWLTFILITTLSCQIWAQQSKSASVQSAANPADAAKVAEVIAFEKEVEAAVLRGDSKFLERALSNDFLFTHGDAWTTGGPNAAYFLQAVAVRANKSGTFLCDRVQS